MTLRRLAPVVAVAALLWGAAPARPAGAPPELPARLDNPAFWRLTRELSEPGGYFRSDNLVSNEPVFAALLPVLAERVAPGGVYLGVGPEQNFTYIAAMRPRLAVILDIRRGNLRLHLFYKALFELSEDRAGFLARLFGRAPLAGAASGATAAELLAAVERASVLDEVAFTRQLEAVLAHLRLVRGFELDATDPDGIEFIARSFRRFGSAIAWSSSTSGRTGGSRTFARLATQRDAEGRELGFLADEARYQSVRDLQLRNLVLPVVGDFGGPRALRAIGDYVRAHDAVVSAFYVSNVESYLRRDGKWERFCRNVATLPSDEASVLVRPGGTRSGSPDVRITRVVPMTPPASGQGGWLIVPPGPRLPAGVSSMAEQAGACDAGRR